MKTMDLYRVRYTEMMVGKANQRVFPVPQVQLIVVNPGQPVDVTRIEKLKLPQEYTVEYVGKCLVELEVEEVSHGPQPGIDI